MKITPVDPDGLVKSPAFARAVVVEALAKWVFVGGQHGITGEG